jgi:hypothetical protein
VLITRDERARAERRAANERALDTSRPMHHLADPIHRVITEEAAALDAVRLWPTTPALLRETTAPAKGLPENTTLAAMRTHRGYELVGDHGLRDRGHLPATLDNFHLEFRVTAR